MQILETIICIVASFYDNVPIAAKLKDIAELVVSENVKYLTNEIRRLKGVVKNIDNPLSLRVQSKTQADALKRKLPASPLAVFFDGGKTRNDIKHFLPFLCFDIDGKTPERVAELMAVIKECPHVFMGQPSCSGCGLHLGILIDATDWLNQMWDGKDVGPFLYVYDQARDFIENLLGEKVDDNCRKPEQVFGICGDDRFFLNEHATPLHIDVENYVPTQKKTKATASKKATGKYSASLESVKDKTISALANDGCDFVESNRNNYVLRFATMCNNYGVEQNDVEYYCVNGFAEPDFTEKEIITTINSAYKHTENHGTKSLTSVGGGNNVLDDEYIETVLTKADDYREKYLLDVTKQIPEKEHLFAINSTGFIAIGEISAIKGKQKQGKTNVFAELEAVNISGKWGKIDRVSEASFKSLYFDTEQHPADTAVICERACNMAQVEFTNHYEWLMPYTLRDVFDIEQLKEIVVSQIAQEKPLLVCIDGIVDLIENFNDVVESKEVIDWLCAVASKFNCALICTLHENKNADDKNMRGHLGTRLSQKATTTLQCSKDKKTQIFTVSSDDERRKPLEGWSFMFQNDNIVCADELKAQLDKQMQQTRAEKQAQKKQEEQEKHLRDLTDILNARLGGYMSLTNLKKLYQEKTGISALSTCKTHIMALVDAGKLFKSDDDLISLEPIPDVF